MGTEDVDLAVEKDLCERDHLYFTRFFFKARQNIKFRVNWHHQLIADKLQEVIDGRIESLLITVSPGSSKCVYQSSNIMTTKGMVAASKIKRGDMLYSHDDGNVVIEKCLGTETARKQSFKILMRSGREIIISHDHPMLSIHGYKKAEEFQIGDRIRCLAAKIDGSEPYNIDEISFIAFMIFEGNCKGLNLRWTGQDNLATREFLAICKRLGIGIKKYTSSRVYDFNILGGQSGTAATLLNKYGILGCLSTEKRLPRNWTALPLIAKYRILDIMFATDGFVQIKKGTLAVTLANKNLIQDIQHLLSSCGIVSSFHNYKNNHAGYSALVIPREHSMLLLDHLSLFHKRERLEQNRHIKAQSYLLSYPKEILKNIKGFWYWSKFNGSHAHKKTITQATFEICAAKFPDLNEFRNKDFYWDRIKSIEDVGIQDLIHLQVRRTKNFLLEGLVSHNTEIAVINFIARGLALNPRARFLHLSGSDSLASLNSATARDIVLSDEYQQFWPVKIADDASAKKRWNVEAEGKILGGVYATSLAGQVTGFRAGHMADGFTGALICDDPIKPEDAFSKNKLEAANRRLLTTVKSRLANPKIPIILIMQRIAELDPAGFIESGNFEGNWTQLKIPALIDDAYVKTLDEKYQKLVDSSHRSADGRFSYWPYKEPVEQLIAMEKGGGSDSSGQKISRHVFNSQYQQAPIAMGGNIIKGENFVRYKMAPRIKHRKIFADTAMKTKERNDFSVFEEWGVGTDGKIYLLDMIRGKWEAPELLKRAIAFWRKCAAKDAAEFGQLRKMIIEDKSSGTGLIQSLKTPDTIPGQLPVRIPIEGVERNKDKFTRVNDALPYIESGCVCIPEEAPFTNDFVAECEAFTADMSHAHDDQIDPMLDAIMDLLSNSLLRRWEQLAPKN